MNEEDKPLIMSDEQVARLMSVKQRAQKFQSNGRGAGWWFTSWGIVLFAFGKLMPLPDWSMWVFCLIGCTTTLLGTMMLGVSFDKEKESR